MQSCLRAWRSQTSFVNFTVTHVHKNAWFSESFDMQRAQKMTGAALALLLLSVSNNWSALWFCPVCFARLCRCRFKFMNRIQWWWFLPLLCVGCKSEEIEAVVPVTELMKHAYKLQTFALVLCIMTNRKYTTLVCSSLLCYLSETWVITISLSPQLAP